MKISYNWLKSYIPEIPEPNKLADLIIFHVCEIEDIEKLQNGDHIFDLKILPDRAHDLLSHRGVAREISGLLGIDFKDPRGMYKTPASKETDLKIDIETDKCRRYMGRIVHGVKIGPSPDWLVEHLESIGQRSINNVVDATNIVMYDIGEPCHAFDLRKIKNNSISVRLAKNDEELKLVGRDAAVAKLKDSDLVISSGGENLALAGVKGGFDSGVANDTTDLLIEVANFDPVFVRKTARRIGQLSDSAKRFENDLSETLCDDGMFDLSALLIELFPDASFENIVDIRPAPQKEHKISFSSDYISKMLGLKIPENEIEKILEQYKFEFTKEKDSLSASDGSIFNTKVPLLRLDLRSREDMVEEIGRVYGYDKIKPVIPKVDSIHKTNETYQKILDIRDALVKDGYREVMTYAFTNEGDVEVLASASDKNFVRTNLSDGLKNSYELNKLNAPFLGLPEIKIFEIGTVFTKDGEQINVAYNEKEKIIEKSLDEFDAKLEQENFAASSEVALERSSDLLSDFQSAGQTVSKATSDFAPDNLIFKMWSLYPFITRDIAVWVPEGVSPEQLSDIYKDLGTDLLIKDPTLIDTFTKPASTVGGQGRTSYAFRLVFQSYDRTLTDGEINSIMQKISEKLSSLGYEVR